MKLKVKDLSHLVEIWKLVEKDPGTTGIHLDRAGAHLAGMHVGASRHLKLPLDKSVTVDGAMLSGALGLFVPDAEINIKQTDATLILSAEGRRAVLRTHRNAPPREPLEFTATPLNATKLRDALPFLRACTTGGVVTPVLTGIHFVHLGGGRLLLEATDATCRSGRLILSLPPCKAQGQVVPAADLETALSLLGKKIALRFGRDHLRLRDKRTIIKLSLLQGAYPDLSKLSTNYKHHIKLLKSQLDVAVRAGVLLDSDRLVTLTIKDKQAALLVRGQETGGFREPIGRCNLEDIEITFDVHWLDATQHIGSNIKLRYNNARTPVLFSGSKRLLWMSPVVK